MKVDDAGVGALIVTTTLATLSGVALWVEGIGAFLSAVVAVLVWWVLGLLYEIWEGK